MTSAVLPEFMLGLLEAEMAAATLGVVRYVCQEYGLPYEEVKNKIASRVNIEIDVDTKSNYRVRKTMVKPIKARTEEEQCIAMMFCKDQRDVRRCTKRHGEGCGKFCKIHYKMWKGDGLAYGTASDP